MLMFFKQHIFPRQQTIPNIFKGFWCRLQYPQGIHQLSSLGQGKCVCLCMHVYAATCSGVNEHVKFQASDCPLDGMHSSIIFSKSKSGIGRVSMSSTDFLGT